MKISVPSFYPIDDKEDKMYYVKFYKGPQNPIPLFSDKEYHENITLEEASKKIAKLIQDYGGLHHFFNRFSGSLKHNENGPGTVLHSMLEKLGFKAKSGCGCLDKARVMNAMGPDWCEKNIDLILDWLEEQSKKRNIMFIRTIARLIVRKAIKKSRKLQNAKL